MTEKTFAALHALADAFAPAISDDVVSHLFSGVGTGQATIDFLLAQSTARPTAIALVSNGRILLGHTPHIYLQVAQGFSGRLSGRRRCEKSKNQRDERDSEGWNHHGRN